VVVVLLDQASEARVEVVLLDEKVGEEVAVVVRVCFVRHVGSLFEAYTTLWRDRLLALGSREGRRFTEELGRRDDLVSVEPRLREGVIA
jgi:hypothetical protein